MNHIIIALKMHDIFDILTHLLIFYLFNIEECYYYCMK